MCSTAVGRGCAVHSMDWSSVEDMHTALATLGIRNIKPLFTAHPPEPPSPPPRWVSLRAGLAPGDAGVPCRRACLGKPNNRLTGIFSPLNAYRGRLFLPIPPERVLGGIFS